MANTISGNAGVAGAAIALTGAATASTTSASDGTYAFAGLLPGAYVITPTLAGVTFTPAFLNETIVVTDITTANFVAQATVFSPSPNATDDFHRTDAPTLGPNWTVPSFPGANALSIASFLAVPAVAGGGTERYAAEGFANNQFAAITLDLFAISSEIDVVVRTDITVATGYAAALVGDGLGGYTLILNDYASGFPAGVAFTLSGAPQPGDIVKIQAVGTLVTAFYNGVPVTSATITDAASGSPAIFMQSTAVNTDTSISLFTAGAEVFVISGSCGASGAGATVLLGGQSSASTTAAGGTGNYSFAGLAPGTYYITPELTGAEFSPSDQTVVITAADVTGINFTLFTPSKPGSNSETIVASGPNFATRIVSPRTSIIGTNLGTRILR